MKIDVVGSSEPYASFTRLTTDVVEALQLCGHDVSLQLFNGKQDDLPGSVAKVCGPTRKDALRFNVHFISESLLSDVQHGDVVLTAWETTALPKRYVDTLNKASLVVGISSFVQDTLYRAGVVKARRTLPCCVRDTEYYPSFTAFPRHAIFATAGRFAGCKVRKGIDRVVSAFLLAFPTEQDVVLRVKATPDSDVMQVSDKRVQVLKTHLTIDNMRRFYQEALCCVFGSACEGWGLHQHEAMACAKPLISNRWGGVCDYFVAPDHGWEAKGVKTQVSDYYTDRSVGFWYPPSVESLATAMREVYENCVDAYMRGWAAYEAARGLDFPAYCKNLDNIIKHV